ncbi:MAG: protein translocase subunit SecF [Candidatus Paceibacterota bacterium]
MFIIKNKKIFIGISLVLVLLSIISVSVFGLRIGIDFKGGALTEVVYDEARPSQDILNAEIATLDFGSVLIQPAGDNGYLIKSRDLTDPEHDLLLETLSLDGAHTLKETAFNSIGPSVGRELTRKAIIAIVLVSLAIICFIAYAFRKVSKPVSSWRYGFIAIVSLLHDIIIPIGIFSLLSYYFGAEVDTLFVVAILTVLGLSVSDTIVIFDRIRENLSTEPNITKADFGNIVGKSLSQSFVRSLSTSLSTILVLVALFFFGPESTKYFALVLITGMFFGTYSSIFLASPLLVLVSTFKSK